MPIRIASLGFALILAACGGASPGASIDEGPSSGGAPSQAAGESADAGEPTPGTALTACELVTAADVEAALGLDPGTVSEGVHQETPTVLSPASNECRYTDETWGGLVVSVIPDDGVNTFDAVESSFGDDAEVLDLGDGALWFPDNDRGYFLSGPVMVMLQYTHLIDETDWRAATVALGEAALGRL